MPPPCSRPKWMLVGCMLLAGCAGTPSQRRADTYRFDTVSNACRQNPANCAALAGKETVGTTMAAAATTGYVVVRALEDPVRDLIDAILVECADRARSEVLLRHRQDFAGQSPSREECNQQVKDATGRRVSRAMQLGTEMHQIAKRCAKERLGKLRPGGFSLEPHYRYDPGSGRTTHIPDKDVAALRESGNQGELLGTLAPDVVIHAGSPFQIQAVYDFKFPCFHLDGMPDWSAYPPGHPHQGLRQDQAYKRALGEPAARVAPRIGVER
jgi:hypothetical protein